jgi:hypothetical protein
VTDTRKMTVVALLLVGARGANVAAQEARGVAAGARALQTEESEAALPDVDAIERGERGRASVSFRAPTAPRAGGESATAAAVDGLRSSGGIYGLDHAGAPASGERVRSDAVPELHTVQKGDTLWTLCDQYYGDPWSWPKLWAQNPLVTNPHWIFPGDVLRLRGAGEVIAAPAAADGPRIGTTRDFGARGVALREAGFIAAGDLGKAAVISGSREEKIMLSTGDQAYVRFPKDRPLHAGERYSVFKPDREHPVRSEKGEVLGYLVRVYGDIVVGQIADEQTGRGQLQSIVDPVERGYWVSAHVQPFKRVEPRPSAVNLETRVVASFSPTLLLAADNFVVLSRGSRDGVAVGNRSFVIRRGDGFRPVREGWSESFDPSYPKEVVGELWVVDVQERTSIAWVARTAKEIRVGETVELRKGY